MPITIKCPFFQWDKADRVGCEAGIVYYRNAGIKNEYVRDYCASLAGHRNCALARLLYKEYDMKGVEVHGL